jgi:tetratricopeptide (TPR) repeat protein
MKFIFVLLISLPFFNNCDAQFHKQKPLPAARKLHDSALKIYTDAKGDPACVPKVGALLDASVKTDKYYWESWVDKLNFECHFDKFAKGLKTTEQMVKIFPNDADVYFYAGILQYKNNKSKEAHVSFEKLLTIYNSDLQDKNKVKYYKAININKGIALILLDRPAEGKRILQKLYDAEGDDVVKSFLGFYINSSKQELIDDKVPGK